MLSRIKPLKIGKRCYVLFKIACKRGATFYDVMDYNGVILGRNLLKEDAIEMAQLHWVRTTPKPPRRSKQKSIKRTYQREINMQDFLEFTSCNAEEIVQNEYHLENNHGS